jgi:hypothetical protein
LDHHGAPSSFLLFPKTTHTGEREETLGKIGEFWRGNWVFLALAGNGGVSFPSVIEIINWEVEY